MGVSWSLEANGLYYKTTIRAPLIGQCLTAIPEATVLFILGQALGGM